uniref:Cilia- and flagella-associated protein 43 n=2 Tax=Bursaphelenchus xylophilus TaxID=6326 RepID=A0A1I7S9F5_BURXY
MDSSDAGLVVCVEIGVIFIFPPRSDDENFNRWTNSRAIVVDSIYTNSPCLQCSLDSTGQQLFYVDAESLWYCNVQYVEAVCRDGMRLILAQHSKPVKSISSDFEGSKEVMTLDESGLVIITSGLTKKLLATHLDREIINGVILKGGNKVLIMTPLKLQVYWVLCRALVEEKVVMETKESHRFLALSQNARATKLAVLTTDTMYVLDICTFQKTCYVIVGSKENVVALRWSADDKTIACLSNSDTVCLIDVIEGRLLWTIDFKLRFFVDLSCRAETVYVMGNKFMMSRLENGKELESTNVHQEGISLKASSTSLLSTDTVHFVTSSGGNVNRVSIDDPDQTYLINCPDKNAITTLFHDPNEDQLFVGFEDGRVVCFKVMTAEEKDNDQTIYSNDYVLCAVSKLQQYETEIKNLKVQCNLIRAQSAGVLDEYKHTKEGEILDLKTELETTLQAMREKMKRAEEKYEAIEASKEESFARMKKEMDEQVETQKQYYEKLVSDQIKSSLEKDEFNQQRLEGVEEDFKEKLAEMKGTFKEEEKRWHKIEAGLQQDIKHLKHEKHKLEKTVEALMVKRSDEKKAYEKSLAKMKQKAQDESKENVNQIKQLKAYLLREKEAREKADSQTADVRTELANVQEELDKAREEIDSMLRTMNEENQRNLESIKKLEERNKEFEVLRQKQRLITSELDKERTLRHAHQRRLKHFEMLIDEMSEHIYDSRKLEQSVLGLLAFFNSVPKSGQMLTAEQIDNIGKTQTAKTRKVVQLGTSRHKAH